MRFLGRGCVVPSFPTENVYVTHRSMGEGGAKGKVVTGPRSPSLTELQENRDHTDPTDSG